MSAPMSVIVPAHDEAAIIGANLERMARGAPEGLLEFVVVANGCRDDTAARARAALPSATVVELETGSKIAALNAGDAVASHTIRAYVDADVRIEAAALCALAETLDTREARVAAPRLHVDTHGSSLFVRAHFRVWEHTDYRRQGHVGSGVYALSPAGRARFGAFPDVIADDRYVQQLFAPEERVTLDAHAFSVPAPRTLRAQIRRATRIHRGNAELVRRHPELRPAPAARRHGGLLARVARRPALWPALPVYVVATVGPRLRAGLGDRGWERDETRRM